jgi:hypothetical protein
LEAPNKQSQSFYKHKANLQDIFFRLWFKELKSNEYSMECGDSNFFGGSADLGFLPKIPKGYQD